MKVELQVQNEVKNLLESVQTTILNNLLRVVREGKLSLDETQLPFVKRIIDSSTQQACANGSSGLSRICEQLEARVNEAQRRT